MEPTAASRRTGYVLAGTALVLPALALLAPLATAVLMPVAAIAALVTARRQLIAQVGPLALWIGLLAALAAWGMLSGLWSVIPGHSAFEGLRFLAESACGLVLLAAALSLGPAERRRAAQAVAVGAAIALAMLLIERFGGEPIAHALHGTRFEPIARYDRGVTVLVLLMAPIAVGAVHKAIRAAIVAGILVMAALMSSTTAFLAALVALAVYGIGYVAPRRVAAAMIVGIVAVGIALPLATPSFSEVLTLHNEAPWLKWSGIHRLLIWRFAADRVAERPLLGWGMDASRAMPGGKTNLNDLLPTLHYPGGAEALPLHPHDAALEWRLELGIPGLLLGLAIVVSVIYGIGWRAALPPAERAAALALTAGAMIVGLLSFGIWQSWWISVLWLAASLYAACREA